VARVKRTKKMTDDSPIIARIKHDGNYYRFCYFTVHLYTAIFSTEPYSVLRSSPHFLNRFNTDAFSGLLKKFTLSSEASQSHIALSSNDIISLLSISNSINGILLSDEDDELRSLAKETFSGITDDWVKEYRKTATTFFDQFKSRYKDNPTFQEMLDKLFG
jgi:hypothetical protein